MLGIWLVEGLRLRMRGFSDSVSISEDETIENTSLSSSLSCWSHNSTSGLCLRSLFASCLTSSPLFSSLLPLAEFPERPGALRKFLQGLHAGWNISLFHYRNQGSDVGRVLAGIQVERTEKAQQGFQKWLDHELGYPYVEETKNAVYERFLRWAWEKGKVRNPFGSF